MPYSYFGWLQGFFIVHSTIGSTVHSRALNSLEHCICLISDVNPANTKHGLNIGLMLGHRLRRWPNINPTLDERLLSDVKSPSFQYTCMPGSVPWPASYAVDQYTADYCLPRLSTSLRCLKPSSTHHQSIIYHPDSEIQSSFTLEPWITATWNLVRLNIVISLEPNTVMVQKRKNFADTFSINAYT